MADTGDVETIALLFDAYRIFYRQPSDMEAAKRYLTERLENNESVLFIAYWNDQPAGFTQLYPLFSSVSMRKVWLLNDLYVNEASRNKGIGFALLEQAKLFGKKTNAKALTLETSFDNYTAQALYQKNGWVREENFFYAFTL